MILYWWIRKVTQRQSDGGKNYLEKLFLRRCHCSIHKKPECYSTECDITIAKVLHDSSHLSLWPKKVPEEFSNSRMSFPISPHLKIHHRHRSGKCWRSFSKPRTSSQQVLAPQWVYRAPLWGCQALPWGCRPAPQPRPTPNRAFIQVRFKENKKLCGSNFNLSPS